MACKKRVRVLAIAAALAASVSGCWDARDINDRNIVTAVVVDKTDYGFGFYAEVPSITGTAKEGESTSQQQSSIISSEGRTFGEARENLDRQMDKPVFLGAIQTVILTDKLAGYDIEEYMLRLRQLTEYRKTAHVVISTAEPMELLSDKPENASSVGFAMDSTLMSLATSGEIIDVSIMDVLERLSDPYPRFILPTVDMVNGEVAYTGYSVFSGGMKTGFIPAADCRPIIFIRSTHPKFEYSVPYENMRISAQVLLPKKKIVPYYENGKISFNMDLHFAATMIYPEKSIPISDEELHKIQGALKTILEQEFADMFRKSIELYSIDCFNLDQHFRIAYPEVFKQMNWADEYKKTTLYLALSVELSPSPLIDYPY